MKECDHFYLCEVGVQVQWPGGQGGREKELKSKEYLKQSTNTGKACSSQYSRHLGWRLEIFVGQQHSVVVKGLNAIQSDPLG